MAKKKSKEKKPQVPPGAKPRGLLRSTVFQSKKKIERKSRARYPISPEDME